MKNVVLVFTSALLWCGIAVGAQGTKKEQSAADYTKINAQAADEYLMPIRPGYEGKNPFWNRFSYKFIYAPAFDFEQVKGATKYLFTISSKQDQGLKWSFTSDSPKAALSPVWGEIPPGQVALQVDALDKNGAVIAVAGKREFLRDFPFQGPYHNAVRPYEEAARKAMLAIHKMKPVQHWINSTEPDMSYPHNSYPCKIIGATVSISVLMAQKMPAYRRDAEKIARNAAQFLIDQSRPEGEPLAFFPPTYYGDNVAAKRPENKGKTMTMEAVTAGTAFLDLYDLTKEQKYMDRALGIADTYLRLQSKDGSLPIKLDFYTGEPLNDSKAMLQPLLNYFRRLHDSYGIDKYTQAHSKAEAWMKNVALRDFDFTGQFEDVSVANLRPYENLTNCTAAPYASYLLKKPTPAANEISYARDLIRLSEDQFVYWNTFPDKMGIRRINTPCVFEQYKYRKPVDSSVCNVANAMLDAYRVTGEQIYLLKAKALIDNITINQNSVNGTISTTWDFREMDKDSSRTFWINCSYNSIKTLLRFAAMQGE